MRQYLLSIANRCRYWRTQSQTVSKPIHSEGWALPGETRARAPPGRASILGGRGGPSSLPLPSLPFFLSPITALLALPSSVDNLRWLLRSEVTSRVKPTCPLGQQSLRLAETWQRPPRVTGCLLCSPRPVGAPHHSAKHNSSLCEAFIRRFPRVAVCGW